VRGKPARPVLRGPRHSNVPGLPDQREHATWLHERGAHYLFTVKGNQPTLRRALARLPWVQVPGLRERNVGHGRTESRSIKVIDLDGHSIQALFPHVQRAIKVVRRRRCRRTGRQSVETVYAITSLDYRHADPELLAVWIQGHWGIENRVHHIRDVTQSEDRSRIRAGSGSHVLATLRNTALNLHRLDGHTNIARAQRRTAWRAGAALQTINAA
jgi:predicted transposase YbfD/YdcC